jgi:DNA-binding CsgD family transcriptional regulator
MQPGSPGELSPRQREILALMQAGKVNKEIARELGISLGTVKQHAVAIFKRLNVKNRTMAVYRSGERRQAPRDEQAPLQQLVDGQLERRPCVVLSLALPDNAEPREARLLHGFMAAVAFDRDALFLARQGNAGDIIFGIRRVYEYDILTALLTVRQLATEIGNSANLRGSLTAGVAVASMLRHGGWSGEAIASATIAAARELLEQAKQGTLLLDEAARDLMLSFGMSRGHEIPAQMALNEIDQLVWTGERATFGIVGRQLELARIAQILDGTDGRLVLLAGETGMGKSRLCQEIASRFQASGGQVEFFRCLPGEGALLTDTIAGGALALAEVVSRMRQPRAARMLIILDDIHVASEAMAETLLRTAADAAAGGHVVLVSGRRRFTSSTAEVMTLGRLAPEELEQLVEHVSGQAETERRAIVDTAAGVPLFAVEMARHAAEDMPLSLFVIVTARLDGLGLDHQLLQRVARSVDGLDEGLAKVDAPTLEQAITSGVLSRRTDGKLVITHPLLRRVIEHMAVE